MSFLKKKGFGFCVLAGTVISVMLTLGLLLLVAALIFNEVIGPGSGDALAVCCAGVGVFVVSLMLAVIRGRQALPMGGGLAGGMVVVILLARLLAGGGAWFPWLWKISAILFGGGLTGSLIGAGKDTSRRRHKRR